MTIVKYVIRFLSVLLLVSSAAFADIYSWIDENGERHYSDTPVGGSEQVDLGRTNTFSAPLLPSVPAAKVSDAADESDEESIYNDFQISSPGQDDVQWNTGGIIPVSMILSPRLKGGDTIRLMLDGAEVQGYSGRSLSHQMTGVDRGTHSLQAVIVGPSGSQLAATPAVSFTIQQTSVQQNNGGPGPL
ncbi:MAG: DUF4124 domain-containing protein [Gammaproteobacteria bacterium]|nr:DUF4124 domain-containing protein [Gammaproteobacteria bacterium]